MKNTLIIQDVFLKLAPFVAVPIFIFLDRAQGHRVLGGEVVTEADAPAVGHGDLHVPVPVLLQVNIADAHFPAVGELALGKAFDGGIGAGDGDGQAAEGDGEVLGKKCNYITFSYDHGTRDPNSFSFSCLESRPNSLHIVFYRIQLFFLSFHPVN